VLLSFLISSVAISDLILKTHPLPAPTSFPCRRHQPTNHSRVLEPGYLQTLLDACLRRDLFPPTAPIDALTAAQPLTTLAVSGYTFSMITTTIDRTMDLVRAAVMIRQQDGAGMVYDESTEAANALQSFVAAAQAAHMARAAEAAANAAAATEAAAGAESRREAADAVARAANDAATAAAAVAAETAALTAAAAAAAAAAAEEGGEGESDANASEVAAAAAASAAEISSAAAAAAVAANTAAAAAAIDAAHAANASAAAAAAAAEAAAPFDPSVEGGHAEKVVGHTESAMEKLRAAREVYLLIVSRLVAASVERAQQLVDSGRDASDADFEGWSLAALSLLNHTLRAYDGVTRWFQRKYALTVVLRCDARAEAAIAQLVGSGVGTGARAAPSALERAWLAAR